MSISLSIKRVMQSFRRITLSGKLINCELLFQIGPVGNTQTVQSKGQGQGQGQGQAPPQASPSGVQRKRCTIQVGHNFGSHAYL